MEQIEPYFSSLYEYPKDILEACRIATASPLYRVLASLTTEQSKHSLSPTFLTIPTPVHHSEQSNASLQSFLHTSKSFRDTISGRKRISFKSRYEAASKLLNIERKSEFNLESFKTKSIDFQAIKEHQKSYDLYKEYSTFKRNRRILENKDRDSISYKQVLEQKSPVLKNLERLEKFEQEKNKIKEDKVNRNHCRKKEYSDYIKNVYEPIIDKSKKDQVYRRIQSIKNERIEIPRKQTPILYPKKPPVPTFPHQKYRRTARSEEKISLSVVPDYLTELKKKSSRALKKLPSLKMPTLDSFNAEKIKILVRKADNKTKLYENALKYLPKEQKYRVAEEISNAYISSIKAKLSVINNN